MAAPSGYGYYKEILIQDANVDGNLTDFPVYVFVDADSDIGGNIEDDTTGHDIRFYDVDTDAEIKYEREFFEVDTGDCNAHFWVKVPFVYASPTGDENKIRMYYGKAADTDGEDAENVWDANFKGVWHFSDASSPALDSTSNDRDATDINSPAYDVAGKVHKGIDFELGDLDRLDFSDADGVNCGTVNSFSTWVKFETFPDASVLCGHVAYNSGGYFITEISEGDLYYSADGTYVNVSWTPSTGIWYHLAVSRNGTSVDFYVNGAPQGSTQTLASDDDITVSVLAGYRGTATPFDGVMDEPRISTTNRSANWLKFEHANINEADNELTWGAETAVGGVTHYTITCDAGTYAVTGAIANTLKGSHIDCDTGVYAVTGALADVLKGSHIDCATGSYAVTGATASPLYGRIMHCDTGVYALTGIEMTPTYNENVTVAPAVCSVVMTFRLSTVIAGVIVHGGEIRMFMDLSMN